jgi:hypothetical protein
VDSGLTRQPVTQPGVEFGIIAPLAPFVEPEALRRFNQEFGDGAARRTPDMPKMRSARAGSIRARNS